MNDKKIKVLVWADSPTVATGFAQVARNIVRVLYDTGKYEFDWVGINFDGSYYDREEFPYKIYPAVRPLSLDSKYHDLYGRYVLLDMLSQGNYDLLFTIQDTFIMKTIGPVINEIKEKTGKKFKWIYYFPIDALPEKEWIDNSVLLADYPVAYTYFAKNQCLNLYWDEKEKLEKLKNMEVIYHGINPKDFHPLEMTKEEREEWRKKLFGERNWKKFVFMNINRNQPRKDMFRSLLGAKLLLEKRRKQGKDDVYFYFHCAVKDVSGLDLIQMSRQIGLVEGKDWAYPNPRIFTVAYGFSLEIVNRIYNCVDCVFSTTLGEGFGFSVIEGMATKKPVLMPANTSLIEIIGENEERGWFVKSGTSIQDWVVQPNDNSRVRPLVDVYDLVQKMEYIMEHPEEVKEKVEKAYEWVKKLYWNGEEVGGRWKKIFERAYFELETERRVGKVDWKSLGRNDICPLCKTKIKKCEHSNLVK